MGPDFADDARSVLDARFAARERGITGSRKVIRASANGIRALHREEWDSATELIGEAGAELAEISAALAGHPDILYAGFVADAAKEYAEARITEALFKGEPVPGFADLGIDPVPYLHGLGESVGELRRRLLDLLRAGNVETAESTLVRMDHIVDLLAEMDYPDGMTNGLRRTTDVARALVERSRSDLTATVVQERLRDDLRRT
ncbi:MAG TPA: haloacid dehalogenase [Acidimicrobiia bacterium]|jgi:translin|nr:haloacid dehalogenase [Acidimicrobiia bacterium]